MPLWHCRKCQHEYEGRDAEPCAWCGADAPRMLAEETDLERFCRSGRLAEVVDVMTRKAGALE